MALVLHQLRQSLRGLRGACRWVGCVLVALVLLGTAAVPRAFCPEPASCACCDHDEVDRSPHDEVSRSPCCGAPSEDLAGAETVSMPPKEAFARVDPPPGPAVQVAWAHGGSFAALAGMPPRATGPPTYIRHRTLLL